MELGLTLKIPKHNNLYKLTSPIDANHLGKKLGVASYHGPISGIFTMFKFSGRSPSNDVVFESDGHYYKAVVTKSNLPWLGSCTLGGNNSVRHEALWKEAGIAQLVSTSTHQG